MPLHSATAQSQKLFFCEPTNVYYPTAQTCPVPWKEVSAAVQPAVQVASATPAPDSTAQHRVVAFPIGMPPPAAAAPIMLTPAVATIPAEPAVAKGPTVFVYGAADTPTIVCAVSQICDMALQPGEKINHIILGDPDHWKVEPAEEGGAGVETQHLIIRPTSPDLDTSMIVLTRTRSYHVRLQSHRRDYMLQVAFSYPGAEIAQAVTSHAAVAQDSDDGFVKVGDVTYVKGREPKSLVTSGTEPPLPAAAPRAQVSKEVPRIVVPD